MWLRLFLRRGGEDDLFISHPYSDKEYLFPERAQKKQIAEKNHDFHLYKKSYK